MAKLALGFALTLILTEGEPQWSDYVIFRFIVTWN